jgi:hypothetical protein
MPIPQAELISFGLSETGKMPIPQAELISFLWGGRPPRPYIGADEE